ncbi:MAG: prepilin-type N-terminal cleavage/methylation domain-containing protein [Planctomycetota bacterium]
MAIGKPRSRRARHAQAGFTLVELAIAVLIIGIGMTYVFMGVETFSATSELKATARGLASTIDFCRNEAISVGETIYLEYDFQNQRYRAIFPFVYDSDGTKQEIRDEDDQEVTEIFGWTNLPARIRLQRILLPGNEAIENDRARVQFTPIGSTTAHIISLVNQRETMRYSIEVNPLTGLVEFYEYEKEFDTAEESDFDIEG